VDRQDKNYQWKGELPEIEGKINPLLSEGIIREAML